VFTDNQMSRIRYIYYIDNVHQRLSDSHEVEQRKAPNTTRIATGAAQAYNSSSKNSPSPTLEQQGKIARLSTLMVGTQQVQEINDM
jgi:hypothetical protein